MINVPRRNTLASLVVCLALIITAASCKRFLVRTYEAEVWFTSAPAVGTGTPVVIGEHTIGTTGQPSVHAGVLKVPLILTSPDAVPDATIFVLTNDPRGARLVAHPRGEPLHLSGSTFRFRGAAGQTEFFLMLAKEKMQELTR